MLKNRILFCFLFMTLIQRFQMSGICNVPLMQKFHLTGMKFSIYQPMTICSHVKDKCCSLSDEIKISKLWQERTYPLMTSYIDTSVYIMGRIIKVYDDLLEIDPRELSLKYIQEQIIPYKYKFCNVRRSNLSQVQTRQFKKLLFKFVRFIRMKNLKKNLMNSFASQKKSKVKSDRILRWWRRRRRRRRRRRHRPRPQPVYHRPPVQQPVYHRPQPVQQPVYHRPQPKPQPSREYLKIPINFRNISIQDQNSVQGQDFIQQELIRAIKKGQKIISLMYRTHNDYRSQEYREVTKLQNILVRVKKFLIQQRRILESKNLNETNKRRQYNSLQKQIIRTKILQGTYITNHYGRFYNNLVKFLKYRIDMRYDQFENIFFKKQQAFIPQKPKIKYIKEHQEIEPLRQNLNQMEIDCQVEKMDFNKDFLMINKFKTQQCYNLLNKMINFDNEKFKSYLEQVKAQLTIMTKYKANFYCNICDVHSQKFFDIVKKKIIYNESQCRNILSQNEPVIKFLNILFVQYIDVLFSVKNCYDTSAEPNQGQFNNFLEKYKRRISLIQRCYQSLNSSDFMKQCWFICKSFTWNKIAPFYEGDIQLYQRAFFALFSFLRKFQLSSSDNKNTKFLNLTTIDGLLTEPINPSFLLTSNYVVDEKTKIFLIGKLKKNLFLSKKELFQLMYFVKKEKILGGKEFIKKLIRQRQQMIRVIRNRIKRIRREKFLDKKKNILNMDQSTQRKQNLLKNIDQSKGLSELVQFQLPPRKLINQLFKDEKKKQTIHLIKKVQKIDRKLLEMLEVQQVMVQHKERRLNKENKVNKENEENKETKDKQDKENQQNKENEMDKDKDKKNQNKKINSDSKGVKKVKKESPRPEPGLEVIQKIKNIIDLNSLKDFYASNYGLDLTKNTRFIKFNTQISDLISKQFVKQEEIQSSVVQNYVGITPQFVNEFNHSITDEIVTYQDMKQTIGDYTQLKEQHQKEQNQKQKIKLKSKMEKIVKKIEQVQESRNNSKQLKKMKKKLKELQKHYSQKPTSVNNHIDEKNFDANFSGISNLFVSLFGP